VRRRDHLGFTLIELMVALVILGGLLLLLPARLSAFGARGRLESVGNTMVSALTGAREQAVIDGYEARLEIGSWKDEAGVHYGHRLFFTNLPPAGAGASAEDADVKKQNEQARLQERQWLSSEWTEFPEGVKLVGISEEAGRWEKLPERDGYSIVFRADGSVEKACAVRFESEELSTSKENKTVTVLMNGLTAEAWMEQGMAELPEKKEPRDFP
jgi:prepilin-type N-terminal cleavage/methylation domain-containing protein